MSGSTMDVERVDEADFYAALVTALRRQWGTVDIYSISACFGFYSRGMKVFSEVLSAMRAALMNPPPFRTKSMRLLVMADDHPVDLFGVERLHKYLDCPNLQIRRLVSPESQDRWLQFAVFDGREALTTRPQGGFRDEPLELGINKLEDARYLGSDEREQVADLIQIFDDVWNRSRPFDFPRIPSRRELVEVVSARFPVIRGATEREYADQLFLVLCGMCDPRVINRELPIGSDRLDFVLGDFAVGDAPQQLVGIELKLATNNEGVLKGLAGQIADYIKVIPELLVVIIGDDISARKVSSLQRTFQSDPRVHILHVR